MTSEDTTITNFLMYAPTRFRSKVTLVYIEHSINILSTSGRMVRALQRKLV